MSLNSGNRRPEPAALYRPSPMKTRILHLWENVRTSFWLIPSLMVAAAVVLSAAAIAIDRNVAFDSRRFGVLLYGGGPEGASVIFSTIAGSMITVAGVVFSIIIVALTLTSSQFGSRLLRNFVRDKGNQVVLGTFISTFTYCLLALRSLYTAEGSSFIASVSVTFAMALALVNVGVLIYFIHHVTTSIQAEHVVTGVYRELLGRIETYFPDQAEGESKDASRPEAKQAPARGNRPIRSRIESSKTGYLQAIDVGGLLALATEFDLQIDVPARPGHYMAPGGVLAAVQNERNLDPELETRIRNAFIVGLNRTAEQDPEFAIHQLAEIAIRALSTGINDPFTAMTCVDQLGSILCFLSRREFPGPQRFDEDGQLRVTLKPLTFEGVTDAAFNQIRQYSRTSVGVTLRLLEALENVAHEARTQEQRDAVSRQAEMIARASRDALSEENDRDDVEERFNAVLAALNTDEPD